MAQIKNIIFDLGGVLINIDYKKTSTEFVKLGVQNFDDLYSQFKASSLFEDLETGKISDEEFYIVLKKHCNPDATAAQIRAAWDAMLLDFREESLRYLEKLKGKYNLFLLSNTNSIHMAAFVKIFEEQIGTTGSLDGYFTKAYYSHIIKMRKPYTDTYQFVLQDGNMLAEETLFIEDTIQNVEGANEVGIKTHLLLPEERIENLQL